MELRLNWIAVLAVCLSLSLSGCLAPPTMPEREDPADSTVRFPETISVHIIEARITVTNESSGTADLELNEIRLPHCSGGYEMDNNTRFVAYGLADPNVTDAVILRYLGKLPFMKNGDNALLYAVNGSANITVPAAMNRSTPLYTFQPASGQFQRLVHPRNITSGGTEASYMASGLLESHSDYYPAQNSTFRVEETHMLVASFDATLEVHNIGYCR